MEALCMYISPLCKLLTILRNFCIFSIIIWTNLSEIRRHWKNLTDVRRISKKWNWYTAYSKNHQGKQLQHMYLIYSRCDFFLVIWATCQNTLATIWAIQTNRFLHVDIAWPSFMTLFKDGDIVKAARKMLQPRVERVSLCQMSKGTYLWRYM